MLTLEGLVAELAQIAPESLADESRPLQSAARTVH